MPFKPSKPCSRPGCAQLTSSRFCPQHAKAEQDRYEQGRGSASERGYDARWHRASKAWLDEHPLCAECLRGGVVKGAREVDHIIPHRGDKIIFWDRSNWQSLCTLCHGIKTASEDGGFGNPIQNRRGYPIKIAADP